MDIKGQTGKGKSIRVVEQCPKDAHRWRVRGMSVYGCYSTLTEVNLPIDSENVEGEVKELIDAGILNPDIKYQVFCGSCGLLWEGR